MDESEGRLNSAINMAKSLHDNRVEMGLAIYQAAEKYGLDTSTLAKEMGRRSRKKSQRNGGRNHRPTKKAFVRMPPEHWLDRHEADQD